MIFKSLKLLLIKQVFHFACYVIKHFQHKYSPHTHHTTHLQSHKTHSMLFGHKLNFKTFENPCIVLTWLLNQFDLLVRLHVLCTTRNSTLIHDLAQSLTITIDQLFYFPRNQSQLLTPHFLYLFFLENIKIFSLKVFMKLGFLKTFFNKFFFCFKLIKSLYSRHFVTKPHETSLKHHKSFQKV